MRVFVYYNLHSGLWSVKALEGEYKGLVIAHTRQIKLTSVIPSVNEKGRQRVIRERRKNVHAGLTGTLVSMLNPLFFKKRYIPYLNTGVSLLGESITYNPYKHKGFVYKDNEQPFINSHFAFMVDKQVTVI